MSTIAQNVPAVPVAVPMNVIAVNVSSSSSSSEQHDEHLQKERYMEHKHAISMSSTADMYIIRNKDTHNLTKISPKFLPHPTCPPVMKNPSIPVLLFAFALLACPSIACKDAVGNSGECMPGREFCGDPFQNGPMFHLMDQHGCGANNPNGPVFDPVHVVVYHFYQFHLAGIVQLLDVVGPCWTLLECFCFLLLAW